MKASIITIGTELLIGQIVDTNSAFLGKFLNGMGIEMVSRFTVCDTMEDMLQVFERATQDANLIFVTGGLGPTRDDITKKAIARFLDVPMYFDEQKYEEIQLFFKQINRPIRPAHKEQCYFPESTKFLQNKLGTAPGMWYEREQFKLFSMPGVPYEMKGIVTESIAPILKSWRDQFVLHRTILTAGVGETVLAELIEDIEDNLKDHLSIAYLPSIAQVRVRISGRSTDEASLKSEINDLVDQLTERFGDVVYGYDEESLMSRVGDLLQAKNWTLATAESCSGGQIASLLTSIPGASKYYEGSIISYSNRIKTTVLDVAPEVLEKYGAVSEQTVSAMVVGACKHLDVNVALSMSGIAGPGGGTAEKPVGTVYIAVGNREKQFVRKLSLSKDRNKNIRYSSNAALNLLRLYLEDKLF